jgi:two-component system sensor histidine kinase PilS (NtrC family)
MDHPTPAKVPSHPLFAKIKWLMFLRAVVVTLLLGAAAFVQLKAPHLFPYASSYYLFVLIAVTYFLTLLYALLLRWITALRPFAFVQVSLDLLFVTLFVYLTGGIESIFSWVYLPVIIGASIILYRRGGLYAAAAASILYGALLDLEFYQVIPSLGRHFFPPGMAQSNYVFFLIAVNTAGFFLVALLSSYLAEQIRTKEEELKARLVDYSQLEQLYKHIVQNVPSGLITVDGEGRVTSFNRTAEEITGYRLEDVYQKQIGEILPGILDLSRSAGKSLEQGWEKLRFSRWETKFEKKSGAALTLGFSASPLKDSSGQEIGSILIFQDLTQLREMEEELKRRERLAALGSLAAGMAHEIRNPLASISGSIEIMKEELGDSSAHNQLMDIVLREVACLNSLVADFLLFARPAPPGKDLVSLNDLVEEIILLFGNSADCSPQIHLIRNFQEPVALRADPQQIKQVIWNLLINAAQAMPDGGDLTVELRRRLPILDHPDQPPQCEISISDTGKGIAEGDVGKIFDPFFTTKENGTGLGLSIVHRIVENYGGKVWVRSQLGRGTTFTIYLPVQ